MAGPKKKLSKEDKLAKDRQRKREKYEQIKNDPELYTIQKEKERRRYVMRKELKKISSIKNMTPRAQREQRKRWRKNTTKYLKKKEEIRKTERIILENSPPDSETENTNIDEKVEDPLQINNALPPHNQPTKAKTIIRRLRYKHHKVVKQLKYEIIKLKKQISDREIKKQIINIEDSIEKRVNDMVKEIKGDKIEEVKKKLLFGESLSKNLGEEYKTLDKNNKRLFAERIIKNRDRLKKHKVLGELPFSYRKNKLKTPALNELETKIHYFFEEDANSRLAAGKKEFIKRKGVKKQKRYLTDNMTNLHEIFSTKVCKVSYSTFCKYRPFWIISPNSRDTCQCKLHANVDLLISALKKANITKEGTSSEILKSICCSSTEEKCLDRSCQQCVNKVLHYKEFSNDLKINYYQWLIEKQTYKGRDDKEKTTTITTKKKLQDYPRDIINKLGSTLDKFLSHTKNIVMQFVSVKELKQNLKSYEVLIHVDFSENYCLKHNEEIQAFHFGGSRGQVSLHTGVLYFINSETELISTKSFCTMSKCLQHDAASVWAHLNPILDIAKVLVPSLKVIHFLSDSPTSQYRNRYIFYMITKLKKQVPSIEQVTWNYQEAGHGKGAPDGIGAVVKRTADNFVKYGGDVGSFESFVEIVRQNVKNVYIDIIKEESILNTRFPQTIQGFKGTMNVHQVIWCLSLPFSVAFRKLSCFICRDSYVPCSHNKHLGVLSVGIDNNETSAPHNNEEEEAAYFNIDSPTIRNNVSSISDTVLLNTIMDDQALLSDSIISTPTISSPKVQILSNVPFNWQLMSFYNKKSRKFDPKDQTEFEKFIHGTTVESQDIDVNTNSEENVDMYTGDMDDDNTNNYDANKENVINEDCNSPHTYNIDDWVIVQYLIKNKLYSYIGKIREYSNGTYTVFFLRKGYGKSKLFSWPVVDDEDNVAEANILCALPMPDITRRGQYSFKNIPDLNYK